GDAILGDADDHLLGASLLGEQAQRLVGGDAGLRRSPDRRCALPKGRGAALPALLGRAILQRDVLGGHAARGPLRRHGATRSVHRGPAELLPNGALSGPGGARQNPPDDEGVSMVTRTRMPPPQRRWGRSQLPRCSTV